MAARRENDGVRVDHVALSVREIEAVCPEHGTVVHQEPGDVDAVQHGDLQLTRPPDERALDLQTRVVTGEGGAPELVRTEEALRDTAVLLPGEGHAVALQIIDTQGGALGDDLGGTRIGEQVTLLESVRGVLLPAVLGIHGGQGRVDAPGGQRRVGVLLRPLADGEDVHTGLGQLDRRPQACSARTDHQHHGGETLFGDSHDCSDRLVSLSTTGCSRRL